MRSFGVRMPPATASQPSYGIMGLMHIIPPALAWLWRLVAPRGFKNPSITGDSQLASEGVGSYWPCLLYTSLFAIRFLLSYSRKHDFKAFGWYRIVLGLLVLGYFVLRK